MPRVGGIQRDDRQQQVEAGHRGDVDGEQAHGRPGSSSRGGVAAIVVMPAASPLSLVRGKVQFRARPVDRFESRAAGPARSGRPGARCAPSWNAGCGRRSGPAGCAPGERLPSTRELARGLGISRGTGRRLLRPAAGRGLPGRPGRVGDPGRRDRAGPTGTSAPPVRRAGPAGGRLPPGRARPGLVPAGRLGQDGGRGVPVGAPNAAFDYGDPRGGAVLRTVLASYLRPGPGAAADPDRIVVCTGFSQGLNLALPPWPGAGSDRVAFEDPGYDETGRIAAGLAGLAVVPVPVDEQGLRVDALGRDRRRRRGRHPGAPVADRRGAVAGAPAGAGRLGRAHRRVGGRGRLRRRVPLRPGARRRACRVSPRTGWSRSAR